MNMNLKSVINYTLLKSNIRIRSPKVILPQVWCDSWSSFPNAFKEDIYMLPNYDFLQPIGVYIKFYLQKL
jgi:hypothetical protein